MTGDSMLMPKTYGLVVVVGVAVAGAVGAGSSGAGGRYERCVLMYSVWSCFGLKLKCEFMVVWYTNVATVAIIVNTRTNIHKQMRMRGIIQIVYRKSSLLYDLR